jgi:hypothetical protein
MTVRGLGVLLLPCLLAACAAPAAAATLEIRPGEGGGRWHVHYEAAPGELNDVRVRRVDGDTVRVHDPAAAVAPGERCRAVGEHTAECTAPSGVSGAVVRTGDGNDVVRVEGGDGPRLLANGGPGDDTLVGSDRGADELDGGGGHDRLVGRGGGDVLTDGDGVGDAPVDADILDGGAGDRDLVDYSTRTRDLFVDLADGRGDGQRGEGDAVAGIDGVIGGAGDDDLGGGPERSFLRGGAGDDRLDGEDGSDMLDGGPGEDRLQGGAGNDTLTGGLGDDRLRGDAGDDLIEEALLGDTLSCGAGEDQLFNPRSVLLGRACERLRFGFGADGRPAVGADASIVDVEPHPALSSTGRTLRVTVGCTSPADGDGACARSSGTVRVADRGGKTLGTARFAAESEAVAVMVRLTPPGRRLAARGGVLRISLRGTNLPTTAWFAKARQGR